MLSHINPGVNAQNVKLGRDLPFAENQLLEITEWFKENRGKRHHRFVFQCHLHTLVGRELDRRGFSVAQGTDPKIIGWCVDVAVE